MKTITLRNSSEVAIVDDEDFSLVSEYHWDLHKKGYAYCRFWDKALKKYRTVYMHRLILNAPKKLQVDHRNRTQKLDNRRQNLRLATCRENHRNLWNNRPGKTSKFKGVYKHYYISNGQRIFQGWCAQIKINDSNQRYLGIFNSENAAAEAYNFEAKRHFGEFALLNSL